MANISGRIALTGLIHGIKKIKGNSGEEVECLVIPIDKNYLYRGEKAIYLDFQGFEFKNEKENSKDTHIVKQSFPKEYFNSLTDEQKKAIPPLGNLTYWGKKEPKPNVSDEVQNAEFPDNPDNDLPF